MINIKENGRAQGTCTLGMLVPDTNATKTLSGGSLHHISHGQKAKA